MKALLVAQGYPPDLNGGTEHSVRVLARGLADIGVDVVVVAGTDQWQAGFRVSEEVDVTPAGAKIEVFHIHRADLHYGHWHKGLNRDVGKAFEALISEQKPDVIHVHHWARLTRDLGTRAARLGFPVVVTLHDYSTTCLIHHRVRGDAFAWCEQPLSESECGDCAAKVQGRVATLGPLEEGALIRHLVAGVSSELNSARAILALSQDQADAITALLEASGIELAAEHSIRAEPLPSIGIRTGTAMTFEGDRLLLGCWGSHGDLKGTDVMIDAVRTVVRQRGPRTIELRLAGLASPQQLSRYRQLAQDLPITISGAFDDGELSRQAVTRVHAFVSGTRARETWGVVLDEAHALGLPMILPAFGAYAERLGEDGAIYYRRGDALDLARSIVRVIDSPHVLAQAHRSAVPRMQGPTIEEHARRIHAIYSEAIRSGPRCPELHEPGGSIGSPEWITRWDEDVSRNGFIDAGNA